MDSDAFPADPLLTCNLSPLRSMELSPKIMADLSPEALKPSDFEKSAESNPFISCFNYFEPDLSRKKSIEDSPSITAENERPNPFNYQNNTLVLNILKLINQEEPLEYIIDSSDDEFEKDGDQIFNIGFKEKIEDKDKAIVPKDEPEAHFSVSSLCTACAASESRFKCRDCDELLCDICGETHSKYRLTNGHVVVPLENSSNFESVFSRSESLSSLVGPPAAETTNVAAAAFSLTSPTLNIRTDSCIMPDGWSTPNSNSSGNNFSVLTNSFIPPVLANGGKPITYCKIHVRESIRLYCVRCKKAICRECFNGEHNGHNIMFLHEAVESSKTITKKYVVDAKNGLKTLEESIKAIRAVEEGVFKEVENATNEIKRCSFQYSQLLKKREQELLVMVEMLRQSKSKTLQSQLEELTNALETLTSAVHNAELVLDYGSDVEILANKDKFLSCIVTLRQYRDHLRPHDNGEIKFSPFDPNLHSAITTYGRFITGAYAPCCQAIGEGLIRATPGKTATFVIRVKNHLGELINIGGDPVVVDIQGVDGTKVYAEVSDKLNGVYNVNYKPSFESQLRITVTIRGLHIQGSPFAVSVNPGRDYNALTYCPRSFTFGSEGSAPGQLCRPWGICSNKAGHLIVADRSNNRVQVFRSDGSFLYEFGSAGTENGQFDRPAGVTVDNTDRIIVADKDNHRIQIFNMDGTFVMKFGGRGSRVGFFNYPWDVACNSKGDIAVADTRNHRVQLFNRDGLFLYKFGYDVNNFKKFDCPRGVTFDAEDKLIVSDFNNHRIVTLDSKLSNPVFIGSEGHGNVEFMRPQGITMDKQGNIVVADSKNHRIQVLQPNGTFLAKFGGPGAGPAQLDRPSGICCTPDGRVAVIDFGNNRIQVF